MKIKEIIIESEEKGVIVGGVEEINDNSDIDVIFEDGSWYYATAFTYQNTDWLIHKNKRSGECLGGKFFWSRNMLLVERISRPFIEELVQHLIAEDYFFLVFERLPNQMVWVFNGPKANFPGGIFDNLAQAEFWIKDNKLTGLLTAYPLNQGTLDWAIENDKVAMNSEKLEEKKNDPHFIAGFTSASMEHFHYENGEKIS